MEDYYFFKCIRRTTIQFLDMFNDINIERYDVNGNIKGRYRVPIRYGPKSKAYLWVRESGRNEEMLPMISIYNTGIDFDPTRLTNKYQEIKVNDVGMSGIYAKNAMPYNITFTVNIWALHMVDIDQIYEQILPYFGPHAFIRVKIPEMDIIFDSKVVLNGCSPVMTDDVSEEEARVLKWDTNFVVQTWLFKPELTSVTLIGSIGESGGTSGTSGYIGESGGIITHPWEEGTVYHAGDIIHNDGHVYQALIDQIAIPENEPGVGANWEEYWKELPGTPVLEWKIGNEYKVGDVIFYNGAWYISLTDHTATADDEPGVGSNWENVWNKASGTSGFGWTTGMGTTGFGDSGQYGKIVNRYYTNEDTFNDRDNPEKEIFADERPLETVAFRIVGVDEDAKIILDYESFGPEDQK